MRGDHLFDRLSELRFKQGRLIGRMGDMGFDFRQEVVLDSVTEDVVSTSEIEGELLNQRLVRSSVARHLGMEIGGLSHTDRNVEGIVDLTLDATQNYDLPSHLRGRSHGTGTCSRTAAATCGTSLSAVGGRTDRVPCR